MFILSLPIFIETDFLLNLWLAEVPEHTTSFVRLILSIVLLDAFINPMFTANLACGKLKVYHLTLSILMYSFMFVTYFAIKLSMIPESVFISLLVATIIGVIMRFFILEKQIGLKVSSYIHNVVIPVAKVVILSIILPNLVHLMIHNEIISFLATSIVAVLSVAITVYLFGIKSDERIYVLNFIKKKLNK